VSSQNVASLLQMHGILDLPQFTAAGLDATDFQLWRVCLLVIVFNAISTRLSVRENVRGNSKKNVKSHVFFGFWKKNVKKR